VGSNPTSPRILPAAERPLRPPGTSWNRVRFVIGSAIA